MIYSHSSQACAYQNPVQAILSQRRYLKFLSKDGVVLDLGCGRGLFLELLRENGIYGIGVDVIPDAIESLKSKGFEAYTDDAIHFLSNYGKIFDGIFCSHIVEHLQPEQVIELFQLSSAKLRPGGIFIVITPNPKDLNVLRDIFWQDLTHIRPYPLVVLERLASESGFSVVEKGEEPLIFKPLLKGSGRKGVALAFLKRIFTFGLLGRGNLYIVMKKA